MREPFVSKILEEIAPEVGITIELEPEFGFIGELIFPNGRRHLFRNTNFNINPAGSTEIAKDKGYTKYILKKHGVNVPNGQTFFSDALNENLKPHSRRGIAEACAYANTVGYPLFIKPNNMSQGIFVTKVHKASDIYKVSELIFQKTQVMLVEEQCIGRDYRIVVLGSAIISAYERIPLCVRGDGKATIQELLLRSKSNLMHIGRCNAEIELDDFRIDMKLQQQCLTRDSVLENAMLIQILDNANLSTGGTAIDFTDDIHESFKDIAIKASKIIGLTLSGVDIICENICDDASHQYWNIIEINAAPGLDNYALIGDEQMKKVLFLYKQVIHYLMA